MIGALILAAAPAVSIFACEGQGADGARKALEIRFEEARPNPRGDVALRALVISDPGGLLSVLTDEPYGGPVKGRVTPTGVIEIVPKRAQSRSYSWVQLYQRSQTSFDLKAHYTIGGHPIMWEDITGTCVKSAKAGEDA